MADAAFAKYGYVATLARQVPELQTLLNQALKGKWSTDQFARALQDSHWWKSSADSVKQYQILRATKPGEFAAQRNAMIAKVRALAGQEGVGLTEGPKGSLAALVNHAMQLGWDDTMLQQQIGGYYHADRAHIGGQAGAVTQQLRETWSQYGLGSSDDAVAKMTRDILMGHGTVQGYQARAAQMAKSKYAGLASQIDAGMTVQQIADPYVQTMAQTLELDPASININDPYIQRALTARDPKGAPTTQPLWALQDALKNDKRFDQTRQAKTDAYTVIHQIGKDWGFAS
jgi:hypothetical protein